MSSFLQSQPVQAIGLLSSLVTLVMFGLNVIAAFWLTEQPVWWLLLLAAIGLGILIGALWGWSSHAKYRKQAPQSKRAPFSRKYATSVVWLNAAPAAILLFSVALLAYAADASRARDVAITNIVHGIYIDIYYMFPGLYYLITIVIWTLLANSLSWRIMREHRYA